MTDAVLRGVVGSTAYGLAREGSDVDRLGVFIAPSRDVLGLRWSGSHETKTNSGPGHDDFTEHEVAKFIRLGLKCNPTITELLWLNEYEICQQYGHLLIMMRSQLLSRKMVRDAYIGYASAQVKKLQSRDDGTFSSDTRNRTAKHARHMLRLLRQGTELLKTGTLDVRVSNPTEYWAFDDMPVEKMVEIYERELVLAQEAYEASTLAEAPNVDLFSELLVDIRMNSF